MADVFISYSEKSAGNLASRIADALENAGISCWYARRDMPIGSVFAGEIVQEIENCKVFLVIIDEQSNSSSHVMTEVAIAFERYYAHNEIVIIPFRVDNCELSVEMNFYLRVFHIINACPPIEERIHELPNLIAGILGRKPRENNNAEKSA